MSVHPKTPHRVGFSPHRPGRRLRHICVAGLLGSVAIGCSGGDESVETTVATTIATTTTVEPTTTTTIAPAPMFGDLPSPCGPADESGAPTIAEGQNGSESLKLAVANDHGFAGADNPAIEMLDAALAFAAWCNAQGGIRGLPLEIIDLDAALSKGSNAEVIRQLLPLCRCRVGGGARIVGARFVLRAISPGVVGWRCHEIESRRNASPRTVWAAA